MDFIIIQGCGSSVFSDWGALMNVSALWMRSTVIYNNNIFSAHISLLFTASFPAYLLIYFTAKHSAVSQATIFSIVTQATEETCDKQWPLVQAWDQRLPHQKETLHSAGCKRMDQFGSQPFLSLSLFLCVFDLFLLWFHLQFSLRVCSVKQSSRSMLYCIVCPSVWVCVLYRLSSVIVWSYCDQMRQRSS